MVAVLQLFAGLVLCLGSLGGAKARENVGEISERCEKGMSNHTAVAPYPYPVVYLNNEHGVTGQFLCDTSLQQGGWYIIQRRTDGLVSFDVDWDHYKNGFGSLTSDYWMGLDTIHNLTSSAPCELYVYMEVAPGEPDRPTTAYAHYSKFSISNEADKYRLSVGGYDDASTAEDTFSENNNSQFGTKDNRYYLHTCGSQHRGGWWFTHCTNAFLNGLWGDHGAPYYNFWFPNYFFDHTFLLTEMKIRC